MKLTIDYINDAEHIITRAGEIKLNCPDCGDTKFHLYVNLAKEVYHCFKCNIAGKLEKEYLGRIWAATKEEKRKIRKYQLKSEMFINSINSTSPQQQEKLL